MTEVEQGADPSAEMRDLLTRLSLEPPWHEVKANFACLCSAQGHVDPNVLCSFIATRTQLHQVYIEQTETTKRISLGICAGLIVIAAILQVVAPPGKEAMSLWIGCALLVFAAGVMGYARVSVKSKAGHLTVSK
jgi:hypothetical protein